MFRDVKVRNFFLRSPMIFYHMIRHRKHGVNMAQNRKKIMVLQIFAIDIIIDHITTLLEKQRFPPIAEQM